jgi:hypothetical protein
MVSILNRAVNEADYFLKLEKPLSIDEAREVMNPYYGIWEKYMYFGHGGKEGLSRYIDRRNKALEEFKVC